MEPLGVGERSAKRGSSLGTGQSPAHTGVVFQRGTAGWGGDARALPAPIEPIPARQSRQEQQGTDALWGEPSSSSGAAPALLQHHLLQSCRVSPHQGILGEQSTWSRASPAQGFWVGQSQQLRSLCSAASFTWPCTFLSPAASRPRWRETLFSAAPVSTALPRAVLGRMQRIVSAIPMSM